MNKQEFLIELKRCIKDNDLYSINKIPDEFINDKEIVEIACVWNPKLTKTISENLRNDKKFIIYLITKNPAIYKYIPKELQRNKEVIKGRKK